MPRSLWAIERSKGVGDGKDKSGPAQRGQVTPAVGKVRFDILDIIT